MTTAAPLVTLERVSLTRGTAVLLDDVSLGVGRGERVGVVGRNGAGKTTLVRVLAGLEPPDTGRVTRAGGVRVGVLAQLDTLDAGAAVGDVLAGGRAAHEWRASAAARSVLAGLDVDRLAEQSVGSLSGGERRRVALAALLLTEVDLLVLDEPTNHLDIEAVQWLGEWLGGGRREAPALLVVTHDRWLLDAVATRTVEVVGGQVLSVDGGYAAYVLAKAERSRQAAVSEAKRSNLLRKELAWLRRGAPARTSKPRFRLDAAAALIADEPPPRDRTALQHFATARLGKDVFDVEDATVTAGADGAGPRVLDRATWRLGPGDRVGLLGVNGAGKTTVLRLLAGGVPPQAGVVRRGATVALAVLDQQVTALPGDLRVLDAVAEVARVLTVGDRELTAGALCELFGFPPERTQTPVSALSGGERRRLQLLRLLMAGPNVLLLDEPTNDLDVETLTALEDLLDSWPGTLVVVSHDRYFLERTTDTTVALLGDGQLAALPGGVEEYLHRRRSGDASRPPAAAGTAGPAPGSAAGPSGPAGGGGGDSDVPGGAGAQRPAAPPVAPAERREARKEMARLDRQLERLAAAEQDLHAQLAAAAADYARISVLDAQLRSVQAERDAAEHRWLEVAERAG